MKRLIKYHQRYGDEPEFSNCSTQYEVLPILLPDDADDIDLKFFGLELGYTFKRGAKPKNVKSNWGRLKISNALELKDKVLQDDGCYLKGKDVLRTQYLGFIQVEEYCSIPALESLNNEISPDVFRYAEDTGIYLEVIHIREESEALLLIDGWDAFHILELLGYQSFDKMLEKFKIESSVFSDSVECCSGCEEWDYNDDGYVTNHRVLDCELFGVACGCYAEAAKKCLDVFINDAGQCLEDDLIDELLEEGKIEKIETFIGGMTDGRGGYLNGESVREGNPESVLVDALKNTDDKFLFGRDESGQFQTYFTLYKLVA